MTRSELEYRLNIFLIDESKKWLDKETLGYKNHKEMQRMLVLWHLIEYIPYYDPEDFDNVFNKSKCI